MRDNVHDKAFKKYINVEKQEVCERSLSMQDIYAWVIEAERTGVMPNGMCLTLVLGNCHAGIWAQHLQMLHYYSKQNGLCDFELKSRINLRCASPSDKSAYGYMEPLLLHWGEKDTGSIWLYGTIAGWGSKIFHEDNITSRDIIYACPNKSDYYRKECYQDEAFNCNLQMSLKKGQLDQHKMMMPKWKPEEVGHDLENQMYGQDCVRLNLDAD